MLPHYQLVEVFKYLKIKVGVLVICKTTAMHLLCIMYDCYNI